MAYNPLAAASESNPVPVTLQATPTIDIGDVTLLAGTALIGKVGIDQVTANANEVVLKAGTALAGKVGIDQTTDGTTNAVNLKTSSGAGATIGATNGAAVVTDADGTLQQYLRGIVKLIAAIITVKIDQTTPGTTNRVDIGAAVVATGNKLSPVGGTKAVTTSGTGVALAATTKVKYLYVRAKSTNTGTIYFGDSAVDATSSKQIILTANQTVTVSAEPGFYMDLVDFYIDASVNGEGVDFLYVG